MDAFDLDTHDDRRLGSGPLMASSMLVLGAVVVEGDDNDNDDQEQEHKHDREGVVVAAAASRSIRMNQGSRHDDCMRFKPRKRVTSLGAQAKSSFPRCVHGNSKEVCAEPHRSGLRQDVREKEREPKRNARRMHGNGNVRLAISCCIISTVRHSDARMLQCTRFRLQQATTRALHE